MLSLNPINVGAGRNLFSLRTKILLAIAVCALGLHDSRATQVFQSPRGAEIFGGAPAAVQPPVKTVRILWTYAVAMQTPDLVFKLYHSTNLAVAVKKWPLLTNVPGTLRSVTVPVNQRQEFFILTASNYLGESKFATP